MNKVGLIVLDLPTFIVNTANYILDNIIMKEESIIFNKPQSKDEAYIEIQHHICESLVLDMVSNKPANKSVDEIIYTLTDMLGIDIGTDEYTNDLHKLLNKQYNNYSNYISKIDTERFNSISRAKRRRVDVHPGLSKYRVQYV